MDYLEDYSSDYWLYSIAFWSIWLNMEVKYEIQKENV